jgi:hypothetical protein
MRDVPNYINASGLRDCCADTWYMFGKYRRLGIIPPPDATLTGRPLWKMSRIQAIRDSIDAYLAKINQTKANV